MRLRHLMFEDFMEAIVRLASMVPLPTDADLSQTGCAHAGVYIMMLRGEGRAALRGFMEQRAQAWNREPRQRIWRCLDHLLTYMAFVVEYNSGCDAGKDLSVSSLEASQMLRRSLTGRRTQGAMKSTLAGSAFASSFATLHEKLVSLLRRVSLFETLRPDQIEMLVQQMADACFEQGEFVFEQGDEGHEFYIITSGSAEALRDEDLDDPNSSEDVLATFSDFDFFGERALLKKEPRYASVKATSKLTTMCLTANGCESALGRPLKDCVPDIF